MTRRKSIKELLKTAATITIFSIMTKTMGFFFRVYLSRMLGAEMMGVYQVAFSVFIVFLVMVTSGIPITVTSLTTRAQFDRNINQNSTVSAAVIINLIIGVGTVLIVLFFRPMWQKIFTNPISFGILIFLMPAVIFSSVGDSFKGNIWGKKRYFTVSFIELIEQTVRILLCIILFLFTSNSIMRANLAAISLSLACAASSLTMIFYYYKLGGKTSPSDGHIRRVFEMSAPITVMRVCSALVSFLIAVIIPNRLIASGLSGSQAMTVYGSSVGMSMGFLYSPITLTGALAVALVPRLNEEYECKNLVCLGNTAKNALSFSIMTASVFVPLYLVMGSEIGQFIFNNHLSGVFLMRAAIVIIALTIEHITSSMMNSMGLQYKEFINYIIGTALLIIIIWFFTPIMGINALILGLGVSNTVSAVLHIYQIKKLTSMKLDFLKTLGLNVAFMIPSCALTLVLKSLLKNVPDFVSFLVCACTAIISIIILNICFGLLDLSAFFAYKKRKKSKRFLPEKK